MLKFLSFAAISLSLLTIKENCSKTNAGCFKGRLEIKGICLNYTIKVLEGNIDPSVIEGTWTDEHTGKKYTRVFGLGSPCTFPAGMNEGDEFYFKIDSSQKQPCNVCMAFYPTPAKKLSIVLCTTQ